MKKFLFVICQLHRGISGYGGIKLNKIFSKEKINNLWVNFDDIKSTTSDYCDPKNRQTQQSFFLLSQKYNT
jgi:hypothetical protein